MQSKPTQYPSQKNKPPTGNLFGDFISETVMTQTMQNEFLGSIAPSHCVLLVINYGFVLLISIQHSQILIKNSVGPGVIIDS